MAAPKQPDHQNLVDGTGPHARNNPDSSSWMAPASNRAGHLRSSPSETASLHSVRKRSSFFGRSNSDASSMRRAAVTANSAKSSFAAGRSDEDGERPQTATSSDMRRRKTDPLQSIRDSLFGGKKKATKDTPEASGSRPTSRGAASISHDAPMRGVSFGSEDEYYRHLRKHSISPPFNFQHVTHTARNQLPQLETVDEKDLPGQFWSVAAYQRPRRRVHGIKVDDLEMRHRQMGLIKESPEPSPAYSPPTSPRGEVSPSAARNLSIPERLDEEPRLISPISPLSPFEAPYSNASSEKARESSQSPKQPLSPNLQQPADIRTGRHPKRHSSLNVLHQQYQSTTQTMKPQPDVRLQSTESFYDSNSSSPSSESETRTSPPRREAKPPKREVPELNASMPPNFSADYDVAFRSRQPLPSLPPHPAKASMSSPELLQVHQPAPMSAFSPTLPPTKQASPKSKRSSRSTSSARRSKHTEHDAKVSRKPSDFSVSDVSWEDSVDLAYEEEAEATCDFAWNAQRQLRHSASQPADGKRDSAATVYHADSPNLSNASETGVSLHRNSSTDTIADRRVGEQPHKRGTSVGHRGFLAARKNSSTPDLLSKAKEPPAPLSFSQAPTQVSVLSPVFSIADEDAQNTPFTPAELHYPHIERVSNDYLSDPESYRNSHSSKHRKSSSYGSYDSAGTRAGGPPSSSANTTRWSIASSGSSIPELMHSRPKSKSSLSRSITSQPLETLPQSPPDSGKEAEFQDNTIPHSQPPVAESGRNTFVMRRSGESSDRVMQAAGRAVQRGRPGSYARYSQHLEPQQAVPPKGGVRESWTGGPDWI